jgi:hypothetical protein
MTTEFANSLITVRNSLIAQCNSLFNAKNSLFAFLGNLLVSRWGSLPIFYFFPAWQGLTDQVTGNLASETPRRSAQLIRATRCHLVPT